MTNAKTLFIQNYLGRMTNHKITASKYLKINLFDLLTLSKKIEEPVKKITVSYMELKPLPKTDEVRKEIEATCQKILNIVSEDLELLNTCDY